MNEQTPGRQSPAEIKGELFAPQGGLSACLSNYLGIAGAIQPNSLMPYALVIIVPSNFA